MSLNQWNTEKIKQFENETGQRLLSDEQTLSFFSQDFGKLTHASPSAVFIPSTTHALQTFIAFANQEKLAVTIRGNGLSQCGQSLPVSGGVTLSMQHFNKPLSLEEDRIWVEANTSWSSLLEVSLLKNQAPFVLPYNCNLSVGGVISVGGIGAASFKYGAVNTYVVALEVIDSQGQQYIIDNSSPLFHACLSGQGRFAVITKVCMQLKKIQPQVKTFCFVYLDQEQWFKDMEKAAKRADYIEMFCSPSIQGAKLQEGKCMPLAQWLYGLHLSFEYTDDVSTVDAFIATLNPWNIINVQEDTISSYFLRHNPRFEAMKMLGQWDLYHPWYECFISALVIKKYLSQWLEELPVYYANLVHVVPVSKKKAGFLMFPEDDTICSLMILNPGIPEPLKDSCVQIVEALNKRLMALGGKRYLSGFLGTTLPKNYWEAHFESQYSAWQDLKAQFDPQGIFSSLLYPT